MLPIDNVHFVVLHNGFRVLEYSHCHHPAFAEYDITSLAYFRVHRLRDFLSATPP